ncbi:MAG: 4-(cytidine 5'-diphospho)-2-C-methyl-D-erythritol kinase [Clostridiaceae bacterium]|nr:4-(cytidine 5'-diphospho)-2-C-methyl-D-erythritol kinase [Clostridiaceae bacterium]
MERLTILAPAKINLSIDVKDRLASGYHSVEMIMQTIDLFDIITVERTQSDVSIQCDDPQLPCDHGNIALKAAELFFEKCPYKGGARISLKKNIPIAAGLGGGSSDSAGVLKALNRLYDNCLTDTELAEISGRLGADVAFFLSGGTQYARGIGNELTQLPDLGDVHILLVNPGFPVSTKFVYENLDISNMGERPDIPGIIDAIKRRDINFVAENMRNVLESVTLKKYPELKTIMNKLIESGALGSLMSGSGPTVFGIYQSGDKAEAAKEEFLKQYANVYHTITIGRREQWLKYLN